MKRRGGGYGQTTEVTGTEIEWTEWREVFKKGQGLQDHVERDKIR